MTEAVFALDLSGAADVPIYQRLRDQIADAVEQGLLRAHQALPSERDLTARLGIGRMTVRHALERLTADGVIYRRARRGWFVAEPRIRYDLTRSISFFDNVTTEGGRPGTRLLSAVESAGPAAVRAALGLSAGEGVFHLRRLRLIGARPVMVEDVYLPRARFPDLLKRPLDQSLRDLWAKAYGVIAAETALTLRVVALRPDDAALLEIDANAAGLLVTNVMRDGTGRPFEVEHLHWRLDAAEFCLSGVIRENREPT
ncbi:GntR family transcriptional regulator [Zavarzinia sp. CC-PAN008]|uniref:GntR family transcriptional regulator n=1 Tax=Zavarzinia sp. CC-PAN008 TaxID=3243332 RepID=UPI003F747CA4